MSVSSVCVVTNALRLRRWKPEKAALTANGGAPGKAVPASQSSEKQLHVEGMKCHKCAGHVREALEAVPGVEGAEVNLEEKRATVHLAGNVPDEMLTGAIVEAGFKAEVL